MLIVQRISNKIFNPRIVNDGRTWRMFVKNLCNYRLLICQIWIQLITECEEYYNRKCSKYSLLIWTKWYSDRLRTEWAKLAHVVIAAAIHLWLRRYVQITDAYYFVHLLLQYTVINWIKSRELSWGEINYGVSLSNNSVVARVQCCNANFKFYKVV